jgi:hypothetical protein
VNPGDRHHRRRLQLFLLDFLRNDELRCGKAPKAIKGDARVEKELARCREPKQVDPGV